MRVRNSEVGCFAVGSRSLDIASSTWLRLYTNIKNHCKVSTPAVKFSFLLIAYAPRRRP